MKINVSDELILCSADWAQITNVVIYDPDGWNRRDFEASWAEKITLAEFHRRAGMSTVDLRTYQAAFGG